MRVRRVRLQKSRVARGHWKALRTSVLVEGIGRQSGHHGRGIMDVRGAHVGTGVLLRLVETWVRRWSEGLQLRVVHEL